MDEYTQGCWCFMKKGGNGRADCDNILNGNNVFDIKSDDMRDNNIGKKLQFAGVRNGRWVGTVYAAFNSGTKTAIISCLSVILKFDTLSCTKFCFLVMIIIILALNDETININSNR